jgi:alpha-mannosidase
VLPHADYTRTRLQQLAQRMHRLIYPEVRRVENLQISPAVDRIDYPAAQRLPYRPVKLGAQLGPLWATFWFRGQVAVPREWRGSRVDLLWISHSEATLWRNGQPVQGLNHDPTGWDRSTRPEAVLVERARGGESVAFQIEMACNRPFGAPMQRTVEHLSPFVLDRCDIARFDPEAWELYHDFLVLQQLEADLAKEGAAADRSWAGELLAELNRFANFYDAADRRTWPAARRILRRLYTRRSATQTHELSAIGHAHLDTAWLWPIAETHRKCVRTFTNQLDLMRQYPDFRFAASQAYQYEYIRTAHPRLFRRIAAAVRRGQWIPVGGTWVEPDCNLPSGESLVRQFLFGQRFFERFFGKRCSELWNPDVFGYNGQLPQIMRGAGIGRFLTQKLSWNRFNKPAHHTFVWQGIDGSEVLAHFPPADTYNATASVAELRRSMRDYKDHDRSRHAFLLFGHGDGGGGPTREMIEVLRRARDLQGLPRTRMRSSEQFFERLERDYQDHRTITGELYFEYHRGTYTSQAHIKRANRRSEQLLHDVELLSSWRHVENAGRGYPARQLGQLWKQLLVQQFHDILPGSSIAQVYDDAKQVFAEIDRAGSQLRDRAARALIGPANAATLSAINTTAFRRSQVVSTPRGRLVYVQLDGHAIGSIAACPDEARLRQQGNRTLVLENRHLSARLAPDGRLLRLIHKASGREALAAPGNVLEIYEDRPTAFDAWDIDPFHLETGKPCPAATSWAIRRDDRLRVEIEFERRIGKRSHMRQTVRLDADSPYLEFHTEVDWQESHALLKVAFPANVRSMNATYEMQFGSVERPTHFNTSHDLARFEVPAHRWVDLGEHGFGVALLSDCKYGFSTLGGTMRMSLLRAPKMPDPQADRGAHTFAYALMPHSGTWQEAGVVAAAACFNAPVLLFPGKAQPRRLIEVDDANLVLDTIKRAEDDSDLVLRFYEAHGARGTARLRFGFPVRKARYANLLEDPGKSLALRHDRCALPYRPFEIITLRVSPMLGARSRERSG